jgi:hypothetical protein
VDRSERSERRLRDRASLRAEVCWDDDRRTEAEAIGARLASRPAETVDQLRKTAAGSDWMMKRWALLAYAADQGPWTPDQARLAFDLLGTPPEFRSGRPGLTVDEEGREIDAAVDSATVARREIAGLRDRRDRLAEIEQVDRALVMADLFDDPSPEIRRLRRHESALHGRIRWCMAQLKYESPHRKPHPDVKPEWVTHNVAEAPPEPRPADRPLAAGPSEPPRPPIERGPGAGPAADLDLTALLAEIQEEKRRPLRRRGA